MHSRRKAINWHLCALPDGAAILHFRCRAAALERSPHSMCSPRGLDSSHRGTLHYGLTWKRLSSDSRKDILSWTGNCSSVNMNEYTVEYIYIYINDVSMFCKECVGLSVSQSHLHTMMFQMVDSETPFDSAQLGASFFGMLSACHKWRDIRYLQSAPSGKAPSNYISLFGETRAPFRDFGGSFMLSFKSSKPFAIFHNQITKYEKT